MVSLSQKVIRNTFYNTIGRFWGGLVTLCLSPYIIHRIGREQFGIWAIAAILTGYFGLFDFGIGLSFVKYISEFYAKKEYDKINEVVNTGFVFYSLLAALSILIVATCIKPILAFLKVPGTISEDASFVFFSSVIIFNLSNALGPFTSMQNGLQRMDISSKVSIAVSVISLAGIIFFLELGYGIRGLMYNTIIIFLISSAVNLVIAFKILPSLRFNPFLFSKTVVKSLFNYGYKLQISRFANLVSFQTDNVLISHFLGIGLVVYYQLGSYILTQIRQVVLLLISALVPAVSEMDAKKEKSALRELYQRGTRYLIFVNMPLTFFAIVNASVIMWFWMGHPDVASAMVIRILAIGYFMATVTGVASSIAAGVARTDIDMKFGILLAAMNLTLSILLIIKMGFFGVVIGTAVSLAAASIFYVKMFHRYLEISSVKVFFRLCYKPFIACLAPVVLTLFLNYKFSSIIVGGGRTAHFFILALEAIIFMLIYVSVILSTRYFDRYDLELVTSRVPFLKPLLSPYAD